MDALFPFSFALFFVLLIVGVIAIGMYQAHLRREMWRKLAARYGFRYSQYDPFDLRDHYDFSLFKQGHSRKVYNCLDGPYQNIPVIVFDYQYSTGSGKNKRMHYVSCVLAQLDIECPTLIIRPESLMDRFAAFFGFDDIDFEYEEFNRCFHVNGNDKKFAYDVCHAEMMEFLLEHRHMCWELRQGALLLYSWRLGRFDPHEVETCLEAAVDFVARIPEYLRRK